MYRSINNLPSKFASRLVILFFVVFMGSINLMATSVGALVATGGNDVGTVGCNSIGRDLNSSNLNDLESTISPSDFSVEIVSRTEVIVKTTNPTKRLFRDTGPLATVNTTLGDILGSGCSVFDQNMDDGNLQYQSPNESMFSVDVFKVSSGPSVQDQMNSEPGSVGEVNVALIESVELTWVFAHDRGASPDRYFVLSSNNTDDGFWSNREGSGDVDSVTGLVVTNITGKEGFNDTTATNPFAVSESPESCESEGGDFSFIICPILQQSNKLISWLDEQILNLLLVNPDYYSSNSAGGQRIEEVWARMRNIGYIILIPVMLVMVIGTALGFSVVDAYTVKRALPRLFAAVIFMAISLDATRIMVNITNEIGIGMAGLIAQPFGGLDALQLTDIFSADGATDSLAVGGGVLVGVAVLSVVSIGILGSYMLVAALTLLVVFFVLSLRQMLIIFLMILSPIAIIAWIFPGNDKPWKLWWQTFSKLLLLFPLIMALLIFGRAFASVVQSTEGGGVVTTLLKLTAFIGPFFFIPKAFQYAGGVFANLAGMANDRTKGLFDRQKKYRSGQYQKNWKEFKNDEREHVKFASMPFNSLRRRGQAGIRGRFGVGDRGRAALDTISAIESGDVSQSANFKAQEENDPVLRAAAVGRTLEESVRNQQRIFGITEEEATSNARQALATIGLGRNQQIAAAKQLVKTGTGYENVQQLVSTLGVASDGNSNTAAQLAGYANAITKQVGRSDLAPTFTALNNAVQLEAQNTGAVSQSNIDRLEDTALDTQGIGAIVGGKFTGTRNSTRPMRRRVERALDNVRTIQSGGTVMVDNGAGGTRPLQLDEAQRQLTQVFASTSAAVDVAGQISPEGGRHLADQLHDIDIDVTTLDPATRTRVMTLPDGTVSTSPTVKLSDAVLRMENDPAFGQMKKVYTQQAQTQAAATAAAAAAVAAAPPGGIPPIGGAGVAPSDARLKDNITYIKTSSKGYRIYKFRYLNSDTVYVGVLAQEILNKKPDAVIKQGDFMAVNYSLLDVSFQKYSDFID